MYRFIKKRLSLLFLLVLLSNSCLSCMEPDDGLIKDLRDGDEDIVKCFVPALIRAGEKCAVLGALGIPIDFFDRAFNKIQQTRSVNAHRMPGGMNEEQARFILRCARAVSARQIDLSLNNLAVLPNEIGDIITLEELWISQNRLHVLPPQLGNLGSLRRLCASRNQLTEIPSEIQKLKKLEELSLFHNRLTQIPQWVSAFPMYDFSLNPIEGAVSIPLVVNEILAVK